MPPKYFYDKGKRYFPYISTLLTESVKWEMRSCHPPITIPAWMVMFTGKTPGELGVYGFRHRRPGEFGYYIVNSKHFEGVKAIWDYAAEKGKRVGLFGVPPTYPPRPVYGFLVSDFTTPSSAKTYTFPPWLGKELETHVGRPIFDITYRSHEKERVKKDLMRMLENHLRISEYLMTRKKWDLYIHVELSVDRAHHAFLRFFDKDHPKYEENEELNVIPWVYSKIDEWVKRVHERFKDAILVFVSDHGIKPMYGSFVVNQWLEEKGFLKFKKMPSKPKDLEEDMIDWSKTLAWGWGGYYSRIFVNLEGREKHGVVKKEDYERIIEDIRKEVRNLTGPRGEAWVNYAYKPSELYPEVRGDPPDLMVYFDDLNWRAAGTVGWHSLYLDHDDRGADDAGHDWIGIFAVYDPEGRVSGGGTIEIHQIFNYLKTLVDGFRR